MAESNSNTNTAATPHVKPSFFKRLAAVPDRFPRTTKVLAVIGAAAVASATVGAVKGVKNTDVTLAVNDDVVLDTHSDTETA